MCSYGQQKSTEENRKAVPGPTTLKCLNALTRTLWEVLHSWSKNKGSTGSTPDNENDKKPESIFMKKRLEWFFLAWGREKGRRKCYKKVPATKGSKLSQNVRIWRYIWQHILWVTLQARMKTNEAFIPSGTCPTFTKIPTPFKCSLLLSSTVPTHSPYVTTAPSPVSLFLIFMYSSHSSKMFIPFQVSPCILWLVSKYLCIAQPNTTSKSPSVLSLCQSIHLGASPWPSYKFP